MLEIVRRIKQLKDMRQAIIETPYDDDSWQAAVDWLDGKIAVHEADLQALMRAA